MKKIICFLIGLGFLLCTSLAFATEVNFQWGASTGNVDGYRIYHGSVKGGPYSNQLCEVPGTVLTYEASLDETLEYYLVCRAFNTFGESGDSNEVYLGAVPGDPPSFGWTIEWEMAGRIQIAPGTQK